MQKVSPAMEAALDAAQDAARRGQAAQEAADRAVRPAAMRQALVEALAQLPEPGERVSVARAIAIMDRACRLEREALALIVDALDRVAEAG